MKTKVDEVAGRTVESKRVVVIGQGYVGLPLAMRAVDVGHDVVGFDLDKRKISALTDGTTYIDDITSENVSEALLTGRYLPSESERHLQGFDVAVITVPTPLTEGAPDLSYIEAAIQMLAKYVTADSTVILESTTYPGTTDEIVVPTLESGSGLIAGQDFMVGYSPERIDPGNKTWTFVNTPKVVSGIDARSLEAVQEFYDGLVAQTFPAKGTREAEMTKLLENTFRHVNIALVNELAIHSHSMGVDFWNVLDGASSKPFGFMPFYPGPGVGGHCLPIDPSYLSWQFERQLGSVSRFVKIANDINNRMPAYVAQRVQAGLNDRKKSVNGSRILILGLAYKKNSSDARETPATELIRQLLSQGADVCALDCFVGEYELDEYIKRLGSLTEKELRRADVVVLVTDHDDVDYESVVEHAGYVLDTRRRLPAHSSVELL